MNYILSENRPKRTVFTIYSDREISLNRSFPYRYVIHARYSRYDQ